MTEGLVAGIDLGGTKILTVVLDAELRTTGRDLRPTEADRGPDHVIARMLASLRAAAAGAPLRGVGVSSPGPCDLTRGVVTSAPNLPGWRDVPIAARIAEGAGVPVWLENDANAAAIAENRLGAGRGRRHLLLVALGTGIGGGIVIDGRIYHGASGGAGEVGHMQLEPLGALCGCGRRGCLEALASGRALARRAAELAAAEPGGVLARLARERGGAPDAQLLSEAADAGAVDAAAAIGEAGGYLGAGLVNLVDVFNPEVIVLAGNLRRLGERFLAPALARVDAEAFPQSRRDVRIVEAALDEDAAAVGAGLIALDGLAASASGEASAPGIAAARRHAAGRGADRSQRRDEGLEDLGVAR
jgi:glucokinase